MQLDIHCSRALLFLVVVSAHAYAHKCIIIKARQFGTGQIQMAMALPKWPCTAILLMFMTTLRHLVLSSGESIR